MPPATKAAPTTPPMRACEELDGNPKYQVSRFQRMAPTRPANTTVSVMSPLLTMPLAIVAATERESSAPTKLRAPASRTATRGRRAPVAIEVAIAFAVS